MQIYIYSYITAYDFLHTNDIILRTKTDVAVLSVTAFKMQETEQIRISTCRTIYGCKSIVNIWTCTA